MLQCRSGKRTGQAAFKIAVDLVDENVIGEEEAMLMVGGWECMLCRWRKGGSKSASGGRVGVNAVRVDEASGRRESWCVNSRSEGCVLVVIIFALKKEREFME